MQHYSAMMRYELTNSPTNFMALLTIKGGALAEARNSVPSSSVILRLEGNFGLCSCVLPVTKHSQLQI